MNLPVSNPPVVCKKRLASVILVSVSLAAWFIPDDKELIDRLDHDGQSSRLKQMAEQRLAEQAVEAPAMQTDQERLVAWLDSADETVREDPAIGADRRNMCAVTAEPLEVGRELMKRADKIDAGLFEGVADALVKRALGLGHPAAAGELLAGWFSAHPSWAVATREIQAWRWAVRSDEALRALESALAASLDPAGRPADLDDLRVRLALESNQPNLAFDIVAHSYTEAQDTEKPAILRRLVELASAGDRTEEAARLISAQFTHMPFQNAAPPQALEMIQNGTAFPDEAAQRDYREYAAAMARWQEWAGHGDVAFDTWLRLAMLGDDEAWVRVSALREDLLRNDDFALVLAQRIAQGQSLDKEPELAAILLDDGRVTDAITHLEAAARRAENPLPIVKQLARIHQQSGGWDQSLAAFERALTIEPTDVESQKGRAFALVRLRRYEDGCDAWLSLARQAPKDAEAQETCAALCGSVGREDEALECSRRLLTCPGRESLPDEHLELAAMLRQSGDEDGRLRALRDGFARFPTSSQLRFSLAGALADRDEHDEAQRLLAHDSLKNDPAAIELLISEAAESPSVPANVELFSGAVQPCMSGLPKLQLGLAFLFDKWGRTKDSDRIVASLQKSSRERDPQVWYDLARFCLDAGDTSRAESFAALHITSRGGKDSRAWELLGDIYTAQDRDAEADRAYQRAVDTILPGPQPAPEHPQPQFTQNR